MFDVREEANDGHPYAATDRLKCDFNLQLLNSATDFSIGRDQTASNKIRIRRRAYCDSTIVKPW